MSEPISNPEKNRIRAAWIIKAALWRSEGHSAAAGITDDFARMINEVETYADLDVAVRWYMAEIYN